MVEDGRSWEAQFVEQLPVIERAVTSFGRRYGMSADEIADLSSSIKLRIVEDGYAVFRKFRNESSIATYLTVVVTMFAREYRVQQRGRWRPSAEAQRRGPVAIGLETMVHQKGLTLTEAGAMMRSRGDTMLSDRELGDLLRELPRRPPLRPTEVAEEALRGAAAQDDAASLVTTQEEAALRGSVQRLLQESLDSLSLEDRLLLKLRFWHDASIADAARILGLEQRPLYRRLERLMGDLRARLDGAGVTADQVRELMEGSP
jgi:RNA polymerase sigma factor for flagellar operon FliA